MNSSTNSTAALSATSSDGASSGDPLLERMRSILRITSPFSSSDQRQRRYSDADRPRSDRAMFPSLTDTRTLLNSNAQSQSISQGALSEDLARGVEQHSCSAAICSIAKVFQTTELLEIIFSFLEFKDMLRLRTSNRHCYSVVEQSKNLRLQFFVQGQWRRPQAQFQLLPLNLPGLSIERGEEVDLGQWVEVSLTFEAARLVTPELKPAKRVRSRSIFEGLRGGLGTRAQNEPWPANNVTPKIGNTLEYEHLLVAQPPIVGMQAFITNPHATVATSTQDEVPDVGPRPCAKISCESGITLGFLAETAQSLLMGNEGPSHEKDVKVLYKSIISFTEPDGSARNRSDKKSVLYL